MDRAPPSRRRPLRHNEASLLRLIYALLCEHIDAGITSKIYLNMKTTHP